MHGNLLVGLGNLLNGTYVPVQKIQFDFKANRVEMCNGLQSLRKLLRIARQFVLQWVNIAGQLSGNIKRRSLDSQQQRILWQNLT